MIESGEGGQQWQHCEGMKKKMKVNEEREMGPLRGLLRSLSFFRNEERGRGRGRGREGEAELERENEGGFSSQERGRSLRKLRGEPTTGRFFGRKKAKN